ncbi:MAG TPA: NAD-dependent epimerase/dehydratase family protein [Anaerolineae bacterium]|nr:NAD-dependent epimerase/dehydratase family protein [Anaerolineae bacterium]HPL26983.1 NAD-dependent epimerase/dehydratase family protein [Anaerolineae bacterium]
MHVLITGGAGFLGAALANRLVGQGHHVRVLDDLSAGDRDRLDRRVAFTRGDTRDIPKLWTLLRGVDCVYHLAARVSVPESVLYPVEYNAVNVGGTVALMTAVRDAQVKRVVFASSGAAYGEQGAQPVSEAAPLRPATPYAVSKMAAEHYTLAIGALWGIETVILRVFNAYGPGQPLPPAHAPVIPQLLKQVLGGGSLVIYGSGEQTRDFVYLADVVDALQAAATAAGVDRTVMNVGSGSEVSINELVRVIEEVSGRAPHILHSSAESGGVSRLVADVRLAREKLGFRPRVSLEEGLRRVLMEDPQFVR